MELIERHNMNTTPGTKSISLFRGTYEECWAFHWGRRYRKGDLLVVMENDTEEPGTHQVIVHQAPSDLRDAEDLLNRVLNLEPFGEDPLDNQVSALIADIRKYFEE